VIRNASIFGGRTTQNVAPSPGVLRRPIETFINAANSFEIARPSLDIPVTPAHRAPDA
jgi:hypothetical protein